ncbi:hypothetical protein HWC53_gp075 [Bacillus phage vB_BmeM-Goe8]|uniref:Uncharacterized protein n=1 Tax=Bacillus phage vB_BmeM-Goe8 TaxID=2593638 RepID=A0A516KN42_9CAUD|nr:hypothetical protein HWC53_gp003 [Bacillus phage vB_BmeM-Goe8]YP_009850175.1 hypothetical protein HWC53_gp075 [Bacillus phage vB_BmeM-Goe8]QDP42787.1 hypothetical protein Goe8_c00030 [Bacillus phage vB_BmeM-Goe8]QDP43014.1 hypothetical protein Goe8_c02410 [Bacillus phage vB_BmeM-Goe8]
MESVIDKLIREVQQFALQDVHYIAEQNRKRLEEIKLIAEINNCLIQSRKHKVHYDQEYSMELPPVEIERKIINLGNFQ